MPTTPFLSTATGDPINLKRQIAQQPTLRVPATTGFVDFRSNGGPIAPSPSDVERLLIALGGAPSNRLAGKTAIEGGPFSIGDVDPANKGMLQLLANGFGQYAITDNTTWFSWRFGLDEATAAANYLTLHNDTDVLPRMRFKDLMVGGFSVSAAPNDNLAIEFPFISGGYDMHGEVTQTAGTGSDLPILEHTWSGNWALDAVDKDLYVEVVSGATFTFKCKVGSATTYDGATLTGVEGGWIRLTDESDERLGEYAEQIRMYIPSGATWTDADEFKIAKRRASWTPSLAVERPVAAVNTAFILGGEEIRVEGGWQVEAAWENLELYNDTSGKQGGTPDRTGEFQVTVTPTRRVVDLDIQKALHEGETLSLVIEAITDSVIGATTENYRFLMVFPSVKPFGAMFGVEAGGESKDEVPTLIAGVPSSTFNYDGESYDSHCTILIQNDISDLGV